ncbi:cytochrome b [Rhodanobacter umsongensis]|uniref:Cytochrome b n=1 Tax=Rhodanobacter umsongensis TaxID=633153 RepID=A0ABW0JM02_9GAMM
MNWKNTTDRYGSLSIAMHWLMLLLLVGVYACINLRGLFPRGSDLREGLKTWHFMLGLTVFALVILRLAIRWLGDAPRIQPQPALWQRRLSGLMHLALYVFMIAMPLLGWLTLSAAGKTVPFFGVQLPALVGADKALADSVKELHETIGTIGYYLIGLHAAAALFHHYVARDNTLLRMLPRRSGPGREAPLSRS